MAHQNQHCCIFSLGWEKWGFMFAKHIFMMYSLGSWDTDLPLCMRISTWLIHHCGFSPVARSSVYPKIHTSHFHHSWGVVLRRIWSYKHTPLHENMYGGCSMCWYWYFIILWELDEYSTCRFIISRRSLRRIKIGTPRLDRIYLHISL